MQPLKTREELYEYYKNDCENCDHVKGIHNSVFAPGTSCRYCNCPGYKEATPMTIATKIEAYYESHERHKALVELSSQL